MKEARTWGATAAVVFCLSAMSAGRVGAVDAQEKPSADEGGPIARDVLVPCAAGDVKLEGFLGEKIELCITNRIKAEAWDKLVDPFRKRDGSGRDWRGEFWGKWFTSAVLASSYEQDPDLRSLLGESVRALVATQAKDGYLGVHKDGQHMTGYDLWNRKYVLLGLLSYYDLTGDKTILDAAKRCADSILSEVGPGKVNIVSGENDGMANGTVLEPIALLYRRTGEKRYLEFADYILREWSSRKKWVERARDDPAFAGEGHAYVFMSSFEGICEMYRATGEKKYLDACVNIFKKIVEQELFIVGSGSSGESWFKGRLKQTQKVGDPMETCATVTWMKLCYQLLRLTGDPAIADELERTTYNALLGAMKPDGSWWCYFSPLAGVRTASGNQVGMPLSCCVANGPRGLMTVPFWGVMTGKEGPVVNLYGKGAWTVSLPSGNRVRVEQDTDYPVSGAVRLTVRPEKQEDFALRLRIPAWSERSSLKIGGQASPVELKPGEYAKVKRTWKEPETLELALDMRGRIVKDPGGSAEAAIMRGPIVFALDKRLWPDQGPERIRLQKASFPRIDLKDDPERKPPGVWMTFRAPVVSVADETESSIRVCDYASAGNDWASRLRVWIPDILEISRSLDFTRANWIWYDSKEKEPIQQMPAGTCCFRCVLNLPAGARIADARALITADNQFSLFVNGRMVFKSPGGDTDWHLAKTVSVTGDLKPGRNVIGVEAVNTAAGPAGLIAKVVVTLAKGDTVVLTTGPEWKSMDKADAGWTDSAFDDSAWPKARIVGEFGCSPWGAVGVTE